MEVAYTTRVIDQLVKAGIGLAERRAPDPMVRAAMRASVGRRLAVEVSRPDVDRARWRSEWESGPIALVPDEANRQHYEVPPDFFELILGPRLKYSSGLWDDGTATTASATATSATGGDTLAAAEERMLDLTIDQAGIVDGMTVLDLGCGWGSLSLRIAERFPSTQVVAVSNSKPQGAFIRAKAAQWPTGRLGNVDHRVVDVNGLTDADLGWSFDRIVTVEMLEHVRNHRRLFTELADLLADDGALYLHVFAHRSRYWPFSDDGAANWMARYFFTGGIMPSHDLFTSVLDPVNFTGGDSGARPPLEVANRWWFGGNHYARTLDAWLDRLDSNHDAVHRVLEPVYGSDTDRWVQRWRMFLMACSELFGYADGTEWGVSHQLLTKP